MTIFLVFLLTAVLAAEEEAPLREELLTADAKIEGNAAGQIAELRKALSPGHHLRVRWGALYDGSKKETRPLLVQAVAVDSEGRMHGSELFFRAYTNPPIRTREWKDGLLDGPERHFDSRPEGGGKLYCRQEVTWVKGVQEGPTRNYFPDGKLMSETPYRAGKAEGLSQVWDENGRLLREAPMHAGRRHGTVTEFWPTTGKPKRVAVYQHGRVSGVVRDYFQDGTLKVEVSYRDDARHGIEREFGPDGSIVRMRWWISGDAATAEAWAEAEKNQAKP